jgi:hypothetical protein
LLERAIEELCRVTGIPPGEQFKWSPGRHEPYMRTKLVGDRRLRFFERLLLLSSEHGVSACVVIEDLEAKPARQDSEDHEQDVTALFFERVDATLNARDTEGVLVIAEPSGSGKDQEKFLKRCIHLLRTGTEYTSLARLPLGALLVGSRQLRLLQLADVVASCTMSRVAGEIRWSPEVFKLVRPLLQHEEGRIGGIGLKLHPDFRYGNLYHWLLGDSHINRNGVRIPLPEKNCLFEQDSNEPEVVRDMIQATKDAVRATVRRIAGKDRDRGLPRN